MAKKFVRGITDVKTINNQDFDTNNVNDLLSDGQYNYIHRKKGKIEEYHNLTDNIKTLSSDNTELLSVTNYNKTTNQAALHPKHDAQKEQVLESTRNTVNIHHGENGTAEKTTVDTNPQKVLEHENLHTTYGISKSTAGNTTTLGPDYSLVEEGFDLNNLTNGKVRSNGFVNAPNPSYKGWMFVSSYTEGQYAIQRAIELDHVNNTAWVRRKRAGSWLEWREQVGDKSVIDELLAQKQDKLTAGTGITIQGNTISATGGGGGGLNSDIEISGFELENIHVTLQKVSNENGDLTTLTFQLNPLTNEVVIEGQFKQLLVPYFPVGSSHSNGTITITNDGTTMTVTNSKPTESVYQHGTFTFYKGDIIV